MSRSEQITFNNRTLASILPAAHVIDISVGSAGLEHQAQARVAKGGSIFVYKRDTTRQIKLQVELPMSFENALANYNLLRGWAETSQPAAMYLPNTPKGYINCILEDMTEFEAKTFYSPITLTFTAYDPYFYSTQRSGNVGTAFTVAGNAAADFQITLTLESAVTSPSWTIDGTQTIALSGSVGAGLLVIDTEKALVTLAGSSIMSQLTYASRFTPLSPGQHTITGTAATITWNERWL